MVELGFSPVGRQYLFKTMKIYFQNYDFIPAFTDELSRDRQILFAASICERLLPLYTSIDFEDNFNHRTLPILREILDFIWNKSILDVVDRVQLQGLLDTCEQITSEIEENELCSTEEHTAPYAIFDTLELCLTGKIEALTEVVKSAHSYLWYALNYRMEREEELAGDDRWERKSFQEQCEVIKNHYFTEREMKKEMDDWQVLVNTPILTTQFIQQFRHAANPDGYGIIDTFNE
jgi:uncharacterized protein